MIGVLLGFPGFQRPGKGDLAADDENRRRPIIARAIIARRSPDVVDPRDPGQRAPNERAPELSLEREIDVGPHGSIPSTLSNVAGGASEQTRIVLGRHGVRAGGDMHAESKCDGPAKWNESRTTTKARTVRGGSDARVEAHLRDGPEFENAPGCSDVSPDAGYGADHYMWIVKRAGQRTCGWKQTERRQTETCEERPPLHSHTTVPLTRRWRQPQVRSSRGARDVVTRRHATKRVDETGAQRARKYRVARLMPVLRSVFRSRAI